jgi:hypothetical protein
MSIVENKPVLQPRTITFIRDHGPRLSPGRQRHTPSQFRFNEVVIRKSEISLASSGKSVASIRPARATMRDVCAIVTERGAGCDGPCGVRWRRDPGKVETGFPIRITPKQNHRTKRSQRTAKSCGPGAATLALPAGACSRKTGARKAASPGRARISRKTIARGKPGCLGCTCQTRVHSFTTLAHGAAGAVGARLSLRPLFKGRDNEMANLGQTMPRECCWLFEIRISKRECRPGEGRGP